MSNNYVSGAYNKGKGVGLASIRQVVEQYNGRVEITDKDGTFSLAVSMLAL
ncbi:MAG: GHKL domain-containing protein [Planctomycetes bacterium]|nr:GHKL domain-containing protein [Planctomycetota bacterium]